MKAAHPELVEGQGLSGTAKKILNNLNQIPCLSDLHAVNDWIVFYKGFRFRRRFQLWRDTQAFYFFRPSPELVEGSG